MFPPFDQCPPEDIATLVETYPLAWIVTREFNATLLPLLAEPAEDGMIASLLGHCGRRNLIVPDLQANSNALILFQGPAGYISPQLVSEPNWGPTWNYAAVRFTVEIEFVEEETPEAVDRLLDHMEGSGGDRWNPALLKDRYDGMIAQIIAFRAHVRDVSPTFKLGQDEPRPIFREIVAGLDDRRLAEWMEARARE
ncbi:MAG: FMN-binding negative transcriptional regulator [Novosphingobium sp.]|nr:FMN-binding negative transcriptional regulator [Novosphingobium sp.]